MLWGSYVLMQRGVHPPACKDHPGTGCVKEALGPAAPGRAWASPWSLLTSLFPPSGNSSKKTTREWEPLSEPKVTPACLCEALRGPGAGQCRAPGVSTRQMFLPARLLCLSSLRASRPGGNTRGLEGLGPDGGSCMWAGAAGAWRPTRNACEPTQVFRPVPAYSVHVSALKLRHRPAAAPPERSGQSAHQACCAPWLVCWLKI